MGFKMFSGRMLAILLILPLLAGACHALETKVYFFWSQGCPHCADEKPFLAEMESLYPELSVESMETSNRNNWDFLVGLSEKYGNTPGLTPTTIIGDKVFLGFSSENGTLLYWSQYGGYVGYENVLRDEIASCIENGCIDPAEFAGIADANKSQSNITISVPLLGEIDVGDMGLLSLTIFLGFLDGFNACAMWVLCFLLTMLVYSGSRKRMILIGGTFIFVSGFVYFIFMAAWMNFFVFSGYLKAVQVIIALVAIAFGIVNIKDYFAFRKGISFTISDKGKKGILKRMRELVKGDAGLVATLLGTVALAFGVNLIELICTAGFPAVYTNILSMHSLPTASYYLYLLIYIIVYMIDDLAIFLIVVFTMSTKKFTEKYGRISKLISGLVILALGLIMLLKPELLMFG